MVDNRTTTFSFAGFRTNWLRREEAMKTPGRENPTRWAAVPSDRDFGAAGQNRSRSIKWAAKQEKLQPKEMCFFLTSPFIELLGTYRFYATLTGRQQRKVYPVVAAWDFSSFTLAIIVVPFPDIDSTNSSPPNIRRRSRMVDNPIPW